MNKIFVGLTDYDWYSFLRHKNYDEVNFWRPGSTAFRALSPGDMFLFKLKSPHYAIVGGGFFVKYSFLPIEIAWKTFENKNGINNFLEFSSKIQTYRRKHYIESLPFGVGCIILVEPFFFDEKDWILPPTNWSTNTVVGKLFGTETKEGERLLQEVKQRLYNNCIQIYEKEDNYSESKTKIRLGQGAFRVLVTDSYHRRCAISGEKTLPVLEAAHIQPYALDGPHLIQNGILLRSDIHKLFDSGYITIAPDLRVEVSKRLKGDFGNGGIYYAYHGQKLMVFPDNTYDNPGRDYLEWHNKRIYLG